jgi:hypothetical protein
MSKHTPSKGCGILCTKHNRPLGHPDCLECRILLARAIFPSLSKQQAKAKGETK